MGNVVAQAIDTLSMLTTLNAKLELDPSNRKLLQALSDLYYSQGQYEDAAAMNARLIILDQSIAPDVVQFFQVLSLKQPQSREIRRGLIELHLAERSFADALEEIDDYLDLEPTDSRVLQILLKIAHEYKGYDIIVPVLQKALDRNRLSFALLEILAGLYLDNHEEDKAILLYERCVQSDDTNPKVWHVLADLYIQRKVYDKAAQAYRRVFELSPDRQLMAHLEKIMPRLSEKIPFMYVLAHAYTLVKDPDKAMYWYQEIIEMKAGESVTVLAKVKDFLKGFPDYPEAEFVLSKAFFYTEAYTESVAVLNRILRLSPTLAERVKSDLLVIIKKIPQQIMALQSLAEIYLFQNDYERALDYYNRLLDLLPEQETEAIVEKAREILKLNPQMIRAREILAKYYFVRKQYRKAIAEAEGIIALDSNHGGAYFILGRAQYAQQDIDAAINNLKTALNLDPYSRETHQIYQDASAQKLDRKIMELARAIEKDQWKYSLRQELGMAYFHRGLINEAISEFQVAVRDAAQAATVHKMQGLCYKELGRYDLAETQFLKALEKTPESEVAARLRLLFFIGLSYESEGKHTEALKVYEEIMTQDMTFENIQLRMEKLKSYSWVEIRGKALAAIIADTDRKRVIMSWAKNTESAEYDKKNKNKNMDMSFSMDHNNRAVVFALHGRFKTAEEELILAEQMDPKFTIAFNNKGVLALVAGEYELAEKCFARAIELNPRIPIVYTNRGILYQLNGELDKARELYEKSLALDTTMYVTHINLADILYAQGDIEKAMVYWNKSLALGVVPELAKRRLKYCQP